MAVVMPNGVTVVGAMDERQSDPSPALDRTLVRHLAARDPRPAADFTVRG